MAFARVVQIGRRKDPDGFERASAVEVTAEGRPGQAWSSVNSC